MELTIEVPYANEKRRLYLPSVTSYHTVSEIIQSYHLTQNSTNACLNKKYVFIFKWKHSERSLPPNEKPLLLTQNFNPGDCKFIIRITNSESTKKLVLCKNKKCKVEISKTNSICAVGVVAEKKKRHSSSHFHVKSNKSSSRNGGSKKSGSSNTTNNTTNNTSNNNSTNNVSHSSIKKQDK